MTTVILGAGGTIGRSIAAELRRRDRPVRVVGRSAERMRRSYGDDMEIVSADLFTAEGRRAAVAGASDAVMTVGLPYNRKEFAKYPQLTADLTTAAKEAGLQTFLQIATVYPYGRPQFLPVTENHPLQPSSVKGRYRLAQEQATLDADDPAGMRTIVLRLPDLLAGDTDRSFPGRVADAAVAGKTAVTFGPVDKPHEYVFTPDAGPVVARLLDARHRLGRAYNLAGSGEITQAALAELIIAASGNRVKVRAIPPWAIRAVGAVVPAVREFGEMSYLLTDPVLLDESALVEAIGPVRHTPYEEAVRAVVADARKRAS